MNDKVDSISVIKSVHGEVLNTGGDPSVDVTMEDGNINFTFDNIKGETGNDGATGATGPQGPQGDSAIFTGEGVPWSGLKNTTGQSTTEPMSQKAVTDELDGIKDVVDYVYGDITTLPSRGNIYEGNNYWYNGNSTSDVTYGRGRDLDMNAYKGKTIEITPQSGKSAYFAFITAHGATGSAASYVPNSGGFHTITGKTRIAIPNIEGNVFMWIRTIARYSVDVTPSNIRIIHNFREDLSTIKNDIADLQNENTIELKSYDSTAIQAWDRSYWLNDSNKFQSSGSAYGRYFSLVNYRSKTLTIKAGSVAAKYALIQAVPAIGDARYHQDYSGKKSINANGSVSLVVPDDANYLYVEGASSASNISVPSKITFTGTVQSSVEDVYGDVQKAVGIPAIHVNEATGSNDNDGLTAATAVATLSKALSMQGVDARIILHGNTTQRLSISGKRRVVVTNAPGEKATITRGHHITEATLDEETNIYSYDMAEVAAQTFDKGTSLAAYWIYQDGVDDQSTLISDAERHPVHRGKTCRCDSTKMTRYTSMEGLQGDTSGVPAYYYDTTNKVLYFKIATGSDLATNPVVIPIYNDYAIYAGECEVHVTGVDCRYGYIFVNKCDNSTFTDCSAKYSCGGQNNFCGNIVWLSSRNVTFTRCEAARCTAALSSGTGDGFNAHILEAESGRDARRITATLVDCWAHDCIDDGYSDHGRSEATVIGGVFEYNDCGIANATGACDTLNNVIMRRNVTCGVRLGGTVSSETNVGKGTCVTAYGCLAENNGDSGYRSGISATDGTANLPNVLTCYNCISVANNRGFYASNTTGCKMHLYNCSDSGSTTPVTNATTAINATPITA